MKNSGWNDYERHKVADVLLKEFPRLSIEKLLVSLNEASRSVTKEQGVEKLLESARTHLKKLHGTGAEEK